MQDHKLMVSYFDFILFQVNWNVSLLFLVKKQEGEIFE